MTQTETFQIATAPIVESSIRREILTIAVIVTGITTGSIGSWASVDVADQIAESEREDSVVEDQEKYRIKRRLYLGGPINGCTDEEANGWRQMIQNDPILKIKYAFIDPMVRDYRGRELEPGIANEIVRGDMRDIECSDIGLFNCPKPSVGTSMEIFYMHHVLGKKVFVVHPADKPPSPWLIRFSDRIFPSVRTAIEQINLLG